MTVDNDAGECRGQAWTGGGTAGPLTCPILSKYSGHVVSRYQVILSSSLSARIC